LPGKRTRIQEMLPIILQLGLQPFGATEAHALPASVS